MRGAGLDFELALWLALLAHRKCVRDGLPCWILAAILRTDLVGTGITGHADMVEARNGRRDLELPLIEQQAYFFSKMRCRGVTPTVKWSFVFVTSSVPSSPGANLTDLNA